MGFLDNLFGLFSGSTAEKAAEQARQYLSQQSAQIGQAISGAQGTGIDALKSGFYGARGALGTGFDTARGDINRFLDPSLNAMTGYGGQAVGALQGGVGGGVGTIDEATARALGLQGAYGQDALGALRSGMLGATRAFNPLDRIASTYGGRATQASNALTDALGLGGPEGSARAMAAFQGSPAYQFNLTQGLEGINRARAARGELAGGNIDRDTQEFAAGLASREFGDYANRLAQREGLYAPYEPSLATTGATGRAGVQMTGARSIADLLTGLGSSGANILTGGGRDIAQLLYGGGAKEADILRGTGAGIAGIYSDTGTKLADLASRQGTTLAGTYGTEGQSVADLLRGLVGTQASFTGQMAPNYASTFMTEAAAKNQGAANFLGLLGNAATFGASGGFNPSSWGQLFSRG